MGEGAPRAGLPVPIATGGGISCLFLEKGLPWAAAMV